MVGKKKNSPPSQDGQVLILETCKYVTPYGKEIRIKFANQLT